MRSFAVQNSQLNLIGDGRVDVSHSAVSAAHGYTPGIRRFSYRRVNTADFRVRSPAHNICSRTVDKFQGKVVQRDANFLPFFHSDNPGSI